jgi:tryptophan halogenase
VTQPVKAVVIVGGGTAGWLTAGIIAARHQSRMKAGGLSVTLIESPDIRIIGVGEGTWPTIRGTLEKMGVSETALFRQCDAAFKQGGKFVGWTTGAEDDAYYHPLMVPQGFSQVNLVPHWLLQGQGRTFCDFVTPQGRLCDDGLAPKNITDGEYRAVANYAYHVDAAKFAPSLLSTARKSSVFVTCWRMSYRFSRVNRVTSRACSHARLGKSRGIFLSTAADFPRC